MSINIAVNPNQVKITLGQLKAVVFLGLFLLYPYLIYVGIDKGMSWISPVIVSALFIQRAIRAKRTYILVINAILALLLLLGAYYVQSLTAKVLPVLIQVAMLIFFGRGLLDKNKQTFIERVVRLQFPESPPAVSQYCRQLTVLWTLFFANNALVGTALAIWGSEYWWAIYHGVLIYVLMGLLGIGEYIYRRKHFADLSILHKGIPDPLASIKALFVNGRKVYLEIGER